MPNDDYTPDFLTPGQIQANRAYAHALMQTGLPGGAITGSSGNVTAVSPLSPLVQGLSAGYGRMLMNQAGEQERGSMIAPNRAMTSGPIPGEDYATEGKQAGGGAPWQASIPAIAEIESGNNPNAQTGSYKGIFQLGPAEAAKYGGYGANAGIAALTDKANQLRGILGREPTGGEVYLAHQQGLGGFQAHMSNPNGLAWQNMASTAEGQQKGAAWAKQAIWGNVPDSMKARFGSVDHITSRDFTNMWMHRVESGSFDRSQAVAPPFGGQQGDFGSPQAPQGGQQASAMQFAGPGATGAPDTANDPQAAMAMALARGGVKPPGPGMPSTAAPGKVAPGQEGEGGVPSGFFPPRQQISREQFISVMSNPYASKELKDYVANSYFGQFQPTQMQGPYGWTVTRDARGNQMWIPPTPHYGEIHAGEGVSLPVGMVPQPSGGMTYMGGGPRPPSPAPQGSGSNVPPTKPKGGFSIGGGDGDVNPGLSGAPAQPSATPGPKSEAEPGGQSVQTAARETGTASDAGAPGLTAGPPSAAPALANKPPTAAAPVRTAQAGGGDIMTQVKELGDYAQERKLSEKQAEEDQKIYNPAYEKAAAAGIKARTMTPQIEALQKINEDPRLITGALSGLKQNINDLISGVSGDKASTDAKTLHDAFEKITQSNILGVMQEQLSGLGQVRNMEMVMLSKANASLGNTVAANKAILDMGIRSAKMLKDMGEIATAYRSGTRWDANGNVVTTEATDRPTLAGQNQAMNIYLDHHKLIPDEKVAEYNKALADPMDQKPVKKGMHQTYQNDTGPFQGYTATKPAGQ